ncbi:MAG: hypothetical protein Q4E05_11970, partial [Pseudoclavibacter sp.]|nr:hypothetical protein [Pseudoclavibacter sp.]
EPRPAPPAPAAAGTVPAPPAAGPAGRVFGRTALVTILVLALIAALLGVLNAVQGPRLGGAVVNPVAATIRVGQRVVLEANQPLAELDPAQVRIEPAVPIEVSAQDNVVIVQFPGLLDYATDYTVTAEVRSRATGAAGTLRHSFATPDVEVYSLVRSGAAEQDRIVRSTVTGAGEDEIVFQAPRIQEYAIQNDMSLAVVLDEADRPSLQATTFRDGVTTTLATPPAESIRRLHIARGETLVGYLVDGPDARGNRAQGTLHIYDLADPSGVAKEVLGPGGTPLSVMDWEFVPGTTSVVVQAADQQMYVVDAVYGGEPVPLGQHSELRGFLPGSVELIVADALEGAIVDLRSGRETVLQLPQAQVDPSLYPGKVELLDPQRYVEMYVSFDAGGSGAYSSALYTTGPEGTRELYRPADADSRIQDYCLSPNGEYLAVEVVPGGTAPDGYPVVPGDAGATIFFVDVEDGAVSRGLAGMMPDWCR